jgi:hypothetical protein
VAGQDDARATWRAEWSPLPGPSVSGWPEFDLAAKGVFGRARRSVDAVVQLRREPFALGVVVSGDAQLEAPLNVNGAGVYSGGCVRGREWVTFLPVGGVEAVDLVHGDLWPLAGVHALGGIWARDEEEHGGGPASPPAVDTDTHSPVNAVMKAVASPSQEWLDSVRCWAEPPGNALQNGVLRLDQLPAARSAAEARASGSGLIVWLPPSDPPVRVTGDRPPGWCPVLLVSAADLTIGAPSDGVSFTGSIVTLGQLEVDGDIAVDGGLYAGTLHVVGPLAVGVRASWRTQSIPGVMLPVIVALETGSAAGN